MKLAWLRGHIVLLQADRGAWALICGVLFCLTATSSTCDLQTRSSYCRTCGRLDLSNLCPARPLGALRKVFGAFFSVPLTLCCLAIELREYLWTLTTCR